MNRPAVLRHIDRHVANRSVTAFRLRAPDAARLMDYVEDLERQLANRNLEQAVLPPPTKAETIERRLRHEPGEPCEDCGTVGGHTSSCGLLYGRG